MSEGSTRPVSKASAPHYVWGEVCDGWHLLQRQDLHIIHERMPPGAAESRHQHQTARQFFFVLSGELTMRFAEGDQVIASGSGLEIPPLEPHQAMNLSAAPVEFLVVSHPTTRGDRTEV